LFGPQVGLELHKYRQHVEERLSGGGAGVVSIGFSVMRSDTQLSVSS
jgi:hypothetical protein